MKSQVPTPASSEFDAADLIERLEIKLRPAQEDELIRWISERKSEIDENRQKFLDRYNRYLFNWDDFVTFVRKGPWENSANLHMPLTAIKVNSFFSRLYNIFTEENTTQLIPREETDESHVKLMRRLRHWYLWDYLNEYRGIRGFAREVLKDCVTVGFGIGMKDWMSKYRKVIDIEVNELDREVADLEPQVAEAQPNPEPLQTTEEIQAASVSVKPYKEVQKVLTVFEGSRLQSVPFQRIWFPNYIPESSNLDYPECVVVERPDVRVSEIQLNAQRGVWDKKKVKKVVDMSSQDQPTGSTAQVESTQDELTGYTEVRYSKEKRTIEYAFCKYDIDDDDVDEEIVVTYCRDVILKVVLLDRISPSGMRPLFKFDCFPKPRQAYSRGVPEYLYPLNEEMDQHHNFRVDALAIQVCPFGVYRASSSLKNEPIMLAPGKYIPVDDINDLKTMAHPVNATVLAGEEDRGWHYADMLTSTSSLSQGIVPDRVGPVRSTSGATALLRQMDKEFIHVVDAVAMQWKKMERMLLDDLDLRIPTPVKMRVLGASAQESLKAHGDMMLSNVLRINAQFDMRIDVARAVTSEEIQRNDAEMILNKLAAPSVMQQMGIVGPKALLKALNEWLTAFGKDPNQYLDEPQFIAQPLTVWQEIQVCQQGGMPPMSMQDDHQGKANGLMMFMKSPEFAEARRLGLYDAGGVEMLMRAVKKHLTLAEMMQPQGLPNPTGSNESSTNQTLAGASPQQGGQNPEQTTSRDLVSKATEMKNKGATREQVKAELGG